MTQQVSHRPIKGQSRLWSQRGTEVNGSHHGANPLLRPTGIQIATKSYATLQAMAPTNIKMVHQTSLLYIESNLDRLELLSPTHDQRSLQQSGQITLQPVLINKSKFLKAIHSLKIRKTEIPRSMVVEALSWRSRRASQYPSVQRLVHVPKKPHESCSFAAPCGPRKKKKRPWSDISFSPRNLPFQACDSRAQGFSPPLAR